jgi:DNA-binding IclR family transcriptional regulator
MGSTTTAVPTRSRRSWLDRALSVLDRLTETATPLSAYALAKETNAPLSTIYGVIEDLVAADLLARNPDGTVWLGSRLYRYGLAYAHSVDLLSVATQEMIALCRDVGESVQVCGRDGDNMVVLAMAEGPGHFRISSRVGTRVSLNWTASGRLLLGHASHAKLKTTFAQLAKPSPSGLAETDPGRLATAAREALARGYAIQAAESDQLFACVAAPIRTSTGDCQATLSIVLPSQKLEIKGARERYVQAVRHAAQRVEAALGYNCS